MGKRCVPEGTVVPLYSFSHSLGQRRTDRGRNGEGLENSMESKVSYVIVTNSQAMYGSVPSPYVSTCSRLKTGDPRTSVYLSTCVFKVGYYLWFLIRPLFWVSPSHSVSLSSFRRVYPTKVKENFSPFIKDPSHKDLSHKVRPSSRHRFRTSLLCRPVQGP